MVATGCQTTCLVSKCTANTLAHRMRPWVALKQLIFLKSK